MATANIVEAGPSVPMVLLCIICKEKETEKGYSIHQVWRRGMEPKWLRYYWYHTAIFSFIATFYWLNSYSCFSRALDIKELRSTILSQLGVSTKMAGRHSFSNSHAKHLSPTHDSHELSVARPPEAQRTCRRVQLNAMRHESNALPNFSNSCIRSASLPYQKPLTEQSLHCEVRRPPPI